MSDLVKLQIDGKVVEAPAGTLVINAAKTVGIEIPAFCYYDGLTLQAACRMCLVEVEKAPKLHDRLHSYRRRGHGGADRLPTGGPGPQVDARVPADKPPARLPRLRQGRRVRASGPDLPLRRRSRAGSPSSSCTCRRSSFRRSFTTMRPAASSATGVCGSAKRAWELGRWVSSTAGLSAKSRPTWATTWSATSAACASTFARSARSPAGPTVTRRAPGR